MAEMRTVTLLPLENLSETSNAADILGNQIITAMYADQRFTIMEPAESTRRLDKEKIKIPSVIDRKTARLLGQALHLDGVFFGTITEYGYMFYPEDAVIGLRIQLLDVHTGEVVWSTLINQQNRGLIEGSDEPISILGQRTAKQLVTQLTSPPEGQ